LRNSQSAKSIASAYKHPEWQQALGNYEPQQQIALAKDLGARASSEGIASLGLNRDITPLLQARGLAPRNNVNTPSTIAQPNVQQQQQPPQEAPPLAQMPTAATIAANQAAAQRMGSNEAPYLPGTPEALTQQGLMQRRPEGNMGAPMMPQQPGQEEQPGPIMLGDLDGGTYQDLLGTMTPEEQKAADKIRTSQKRTSAAERNATSGERRAETGEKSLQQKIINDDRNYELAKYKSGNAVKAKIIAESQKATAPYRERMKNIEQTLAVRKAALGEQFDAIRRGDFGAWSPSHLATIFGMPELASADAAQFDAAKKRLVLEDISSVTGRQNVYLDTFVVNALGQIGSEKANNLIRTDSAKYKIDLEEQEAKIYDEISKKYESDPSYGYFPEKAEREIKERLAPIAEQLQKDLMIRIQEDREFEIPDEDLLNQPREKIPSPLTDRKRKAFLTKAEDMLTKENGKPPKPENVVKLAADLIKKKNYILE
jgi:hypothetical protein